MLAAADMCLDKDRASRVEYREYTGANLSGNGDFVIETPPVPPGRHWLLLSATFMFLNRTAGNVFSDTPASGIYICPSSADSITDETLSATGSNLLKLAARPIRIDDPLQALGDNLPAELFEIYYTRSNADMFTLPTGHFLRCVAATSTGTGIKAVGSLRILLIEEEDC